MTVIDRGSSDELAWSCSLWEEKMLDDDESDEDEDCELMKDLNKDVKSGNSVCLLSLLGVSASVVEDEDEDGVAGAVTFAASLIWRFT